MSRLLTMGKSQVLPDGLWTKPDYIKLIGRFNLLDISKPGVEFYSIKADIHNPAWICNADKVRDGTLPKSKKELRVCIKKIAINYIQAFVTPGEYAKTIMRLMGLRGEGSGPSCFISKIYDFKFYQSSCYIAEEWIPVRLPAMFRCKVGTNAIWETQIFLKFYLVIVGVDFLHKHGI
jgi:hypothetical protein